MTYLSQFKPHGCRKWRDLGESKKLRIALSYFENTDSNAKAVRILENPAMPNSIAHAFHCAPRVIFEGNFVSKHLENE